jgi:hypothetical protein
MPDAVAVAKCNIGFRVKVQLLRPGQGVTLESGRGSKHKQSGQPGKIRDRYGIPGPGERRSAKQAQAGQN